MISCPVCDWIDRAVKAHKLHGEHPQTVAVVGTLLRSDLRCDDHAVSLRLLIPPSPQETTE